MAGAATMVVASLLIASLTSAQPPAPKPAQTPPASTAKKADPDKPVQGGGKLPAAWKARFDDPGAKIEDVSVKEEPAALTFVTGPAGIYWKPDMKPEKQYELRAVFSQLKMSAHPEAFGLFINGQDLDKDTQHYVYFLVRQDGKYSIRERTGATTKPIVDWTAAKTMQDPKAVKTTNTLIIRAMADRIHFLINDEQVHVVPRSSAGADGQAGVRINHNLNVQVSRLTLSKR
jgi:hypothetical protein